MLDDEPRLEVVDTADDPSHVEFVQDWSTAVAIARGDQNAPAAFLQGSVRVEGDRQLLVRHAEPLIRIGEILEPLTDRVDW